MMHTCISKITSIGSDTDLSPDRCQAIIWINAGILLIRPSGTNLSEFFSQNSYIFIQENAFENVFWKMAAIRLSLNVLNAPIPFQAGYISMFCIR